MTWLALAGPAVGADITVETVGVSGELADNVRAFLSVIRFREVTDLSATNIRSMHARAPREIRNALRPFGYYAPEITSSLEQKDDAWVARYTINPGEPVRYGAVDIQVTGEGREHPAFRALLADPGVVTGEVARHAPYEQLKRRLRQAAYDHGFRDAGLTERRLAIRPDELTADVSLAMETGPQFWFGPVSYEQDIITNELISRYPRFREGEPFSARALLDLEYALYDSEYFSFVEVKTGTPDGQVVPVLVKTEPRNKQRYRAGLGFGTDTGPRMSLGWQNRRVNRSGHRLALDTKLSVTKQELSGRYIVPLEDPVRERLTLRFSTTNEELGDTDSSQYELTTTQIRQLGEWQRDLYIRLLRETTTVGDSKDASTLLIPGVAYRRVRKDNPVFPRRASLLEGDFHGTHRALASATAFVQLRLETRLIRPVGDRHRVLVRGSVGLSAVSEFDDLPASERFFAGGDQSIRGFALNDLGPRDDDGNVIGGKYLLTGSVEFEWRLNDRWALAVFADAGNALDDFGDSYEASAGFGLRRWTQVGQIRLDIGQPLTESGAGPRIHFSFGPEL